MKALLAATTPLGILLILALFSCVFSYAILAAAGNLVDMHKLISKMTLVFLVLCIFPCKHLLKLSWPELGFAAPAHFAQQIVGGLFLGIFTLLPVLYLLYSLDIHVVDPFRPVTLSAVAAKAGIALLLATLISLAEEPLFRGTLFTGIKLKTSAAFAIIVSSVYYALLHFLKTDIRVPYEQITFGTGFELMGDAFSQWFNPAILSAAIALFIVGVFLALIRHTRPRSLGICIGCHAAWVWQIKMSKEYFNVNPDSDKLYWVSHYDGVVGPLVSLWLGLLIVGYLSWLGIKKTASANA